MTQKIGYHIHNVMRGPRPYTGQEETALFQHLERIQPSALLFLDDLGRAKRAKQLLPRCAVVHRSFRGDPSEGLFFNQTPRWVLDNYGASAEGGIIVNVMNEPGGYGDHLGHVADWCAEVMELFGQRGLSLCIPNWGVGHPDEHKFTAMNVLWDALARWRDLHYYGIHEYWSYRGIESGNGRVGRHQWLATYLHGIGKPVPRMILTEWGIDNLLDGSTQRGFRDSRNEDQYADECIQAAEQDYNASYIVGMCIFSYGNSGLPGTSEDWTSFDVSGAATFQQRIEAYAQTHSVPAPHPVDTPPGGGGAAGNHDLLEYMRGHGQAYDLTYDIEGHQGTQLVQTQSDSSNAEVFYHVKDGQWERIYADDAFIYREADTSESSDGYYVQTTQGQPGAVWAKRFMRVGEVTERNPLVIHYRKLDCSERARVQDSSLLKLIEVKNSHTFQSGLKVNDVLILGWLRNGAIEEKYFYARKYGLVGWEAINRGHSFISRLRDDVPTMMREIIPCLSTPNNLYHARTPVMYVKVRDDVPDGSLNVRTAPEINQETLIGAARAGTILKVIRQDSNWWRVMIFESENYVGRGISGLVNSSFVVPFTFDGALPAPPVHPPGTDIEVVEVAGTGSEGLNIRTIPKVHERTRFATVRDGTIFQVIQQRGDWVQVVVYNSSDYVNDHILGWVHGGFVRTIVEPEAEPQSSEFAVVDIVEQLPKHPTKSYTRRNLANLVAHVVHHTATRSNITPLEVANYHINGRDWPGIAYTFFIRPDGRIFQTNFLETRSYATANQNHRYLSTVLAGNFTQGRQPTAAQVASLRWLHREWLPAKLGRDLPLLGHKEGDEQATDCPGDSWDWHRLIEDN